MKNPPVWLCRALAAGLILSAAAARICYLAFACPLDLAPDEAQYWDWSRHLDWCYYSKGPVVAALIRVSCLLFGNGMLAVRLPAVICGSLLLVGLYVLTVQVFRREKLALAVVAGALTFPLLNAGSMLMTIDMPYVCCWAWALVLGHVAVFRGRWWAWPALGLIVGVGILTKYTMVLWLPCLGLFLLTCPGKRRLLIRPQFWTMVVVAALCCLPVASWNRNHNWVSLRHMVGHAGFEGKVTIHWLGPFVFLGGQFLLLLGFWFAAWVEVMLGRAPWREDRPEMAYLWWFSAPVFVVFLLFTLKNGGGEVNWPATAYLSGLVMTAGLLTARPVARQPAFAPPLDARLIRMADGSAWRDGQKATAILGQVLLKEDSCRRDDGQRSDADAPATGSHEPRRWPRRLQRLMAAATCLLGLGITVAMHRSEWVRPVMLSIAGAPSAKRPLPLRRWDPTCRLRGWRHLATAVDEIREDLRRKGFEPVLAAGRWNLPGELGFYCSGQPIVYCLGPAMGERHSQHDLWRPNPLADAPKFAGKTFILVDCPSAALEQAFDQLQPLRTVTYQEEGQPLAHWTIVVAHGYRGFTGPHQSARY